MKNKLTMIAMSAILFLSSCDTKNADGTHGQLTKGSVAVLVIIGLLALLGIIRQQTGPFFKKQNTQQNFIGIKKDGDFLPTLINVGIVVGVLIVLAILSGLIKGCQS